MRGYFILLVAIVVAHSVRGEQPALTLSLRTCQREVEIGEPVLCRAAVSASAKFYADSFPETGFYFVNEYPSDRRVLQEGRNYGQLLAADLGPILNAAPNGSRIWPEILWGTIKEDEPRLAFTHPGAYRVVGRTSVKKGSQSLELVAPEVELTVRPASEPKAVAWVMARPKVAKMLRTGACTVAELPTPNELNEALAALEKSPLGDYYRSAIILGLVNHEWILTEIEQQRPEARTTRKLKPGPDVWNSPERRNATILELFRGIGGRNPWLVSKLASRLVFHIERYERAAARSMRDRISAALERDPDWWRPEKDIRYRGQRMHVTAQLLKTDIYCGEEKALDRKLVIKANLRHAEYLTEIARQAGVTLVVSAEGVNFVEGPKEERTLTFRQWLLDSCTGVAAWIPIGEAEWRRVRVSDDGSFSEPPRQTRFPQ